MNSQALHDLKGELITYKPDIVGDFWENISDRRKFKLKIERRWCL
jgi:hypothetical protein